MTDPRKVQGSDADRAEGGLDVEAEFAELDASTSRRLGLEAQIQQQTEHAPGGRGAIARRENDARS